MPAQQKLIYLLWSSWWSPCVLLKVESTFSNYFRLAQNFSSPVCDNGTRMSNKRAKTPLLKIIQRHNMKFAVIFVSNFYHRLQDSIVWLNSPYVLAAGWLLLPCQMSILTCINGGSFTAPFLNDKVCVWPGLRYIRFLQVPKISYQNGAILGVFHHSF